jgi:DNA polymerase alpha subunit B N-terminal
MKRSQKEVKVWTGNSRLEDALKLACHQALDDRIDEFGELVREYYKIPELGDPSSSTDACRLAASLTTYA